MVKLKVILIYANAAKKKIQIFVSNRWNNVPLNDKMLYFFVLHKHSNAAVVYPGILFGGGGFNKFS